MNILRSALDNDDAIDKTAILIAASSILPDISSDSSEYGAFMAAFNNQISLDLDAVLNMMVAQNSSVWSFLEDLFTLKGLASRPWYRSKWNFGWGFFCDQSVDVGKKITFTFPSKYSIDLPHLNMWVEKHDGDEVKLVQYELSDSYNVSIEEINDVECFKQNPNLKFLYMESAETEGEFKLKPNIDYAAIEREDYPRQSEFILTEKDIKSIVKFLKKHERNLSISEIIATRSGSDEHEIELNSIKYKVIGDSINLTNIRNTSYQDGITYVKFLFDDVRNLEICYKYDNKKESLTPCYVQYNDMQHFANPNYLVEFGLKDAPQKEDVIPWYKKAWGIYVEWWYSIWDNVYQWF